MSDDQPAPGRERFASRAGFLLMTAGCAIGLGNVWRFPYVAGAHGGAAFFALYLFFLAALGFPVLVMELALGRAARRTYPGAFAALQPPGARVPWSGLAKLLSVANLILLMFYAVVTGWLFAYAGDFLAARPPLAGQAKGAFASFLATPGRQTAYAWAGVAICALVCMGGLQNAVEKAVKAMMGGLFVLLLALVAHSLTLPGAGAGLRFFLYPDFAGVRDWGATLHAAMAQAFFTLSLGIGAIAVCGSYAAGGHNMVREGAWVVALDTVVAIAAGLVIFPCCATFGVRPDAGPSLIFITLPETFANMAGGRLWGALFFVFLALAALSTLIAVFENLVALGMDLWGWTRRRAALVAGAALFVLTLPCVFGFNLWKNFHPLGGDSTVLDLEDFLVSDNLLPLGAVTLTFFCTRRWGWGAEGFLAAANDGAGPRLGRWVLPYLRWGLPILIFALWALGIKRFF